MRLEDLETAVHKAGLRPLKKINHKDSTIYVAESELEINNDYPFGYFQTAWFISKGNELEVGRALNFERNHDPEKGWTENQKRDKRIEAAILDAKTWINDGQI